MNKKNASQQSQAVAEDIDYLAQHAGQFLKTQYVDHHPEQRLQQAMQRWPRLFELGRITF